MESSLLVLAVIGLVLIEMSNKSEGQLIPIYPAEDQSDFLKDVTFDHEENPFTSQELRDIYKLAKNISHSKGHTTQSEEGDPEYRRSYIRKIVRETKFVALKIWFTKHNNSDKYSISDLQELEHLVHQYDTAVDFMKLGGMEFLLPLINHTDPDICSVALSVLTAAMQGNPTVQKYAENVQILNYIIRVLTSDHRRSSITSLYTLSSYVRNNPVSQLNFFRQNGLYILADVLNSRVDGLKSKLKVLELLYDLASEIYMGPLTAYENQDQLAQLKRAFDSGFSNSNLCEMLPNFLDYDDLVVLERTTVAINSVASNVCSKDFKKTLVLKVGKLLQKYEPKKNFWLTEHENELRWIIWTELNALYNAIKV